MAFDLTTLPPAWLQAEKERLEALMARQEALKVRWDDLNARIEAAKADEANLTEEQVMALMDEIRETSAELAEIMAAQDASPVPGRGDGQHRVKA